MSFRRKRLLPPLVEIVKNHGAVVTGRDIRNSLTPSPYSRDEPVWPWGFSVLQTWKIRFRVFLVMARFPGHGRSHNTGLSPRLQVVELHACVIITQQLIPSQTSLTTGWFCTTHSSLGEAFQRARRQEAADRGSLDLSPHPGGRCPKRGFVLDGGQMQPQ